MSETPSSIAHDRRPAVARTISDRGVWIFAFAAMLGGGLLFAALESRRQAITAPAIAAEGDAGRTMIVPPPELALPQAWQEQPQASPTLPAPQTPQILPPQPASTPRPTAHEQVPYAPLPVNIAPPVSAPANRTDVPEVVFRAQASPSDPKPDPAAAGTGKSERVSASRFANPATTVPKGTVMQAVLESALDSTRAGMARAIISRDIYGFDGTKVLIPRGSRLIGEYKADVQQGQNRALIEWQRLMRPDGVLINLDSPSADPLGRAGIKGKVNSHFFARYSGAILQSALEIGDQVAINKLAPATTIYASPALYGVQSATQPTATPGGTIQPTLTVKQGTSVSVFVARDLDFTSVEP